MKQYLLTIYQPDGPGTPPREFLEKVMRDVAAVRKEMKAAGVWVFGGGLHPPSTSTVLKLQDDDVLTIDGPYTEGKEHVGGLHHHQRARSRCRARLGAQARQGDPASNRGAALSGGARALIVPAAEIERVFRAEYGRAVAVLVRVFGDIDVAEDAVQDAFATAVRTWPSSGLPPSPAGWIITTARNKAIDRFRREASRQDRHAQAVAPARQQRTGRGGRRARRSAAPDLYVLPPGAGHRRPGRPDAAAHRGAHDV